jgi:RNA polymerase sigma factor (sigma-70 family)
MMMGASAIPLEREKQTTMNQSDAFLVYQVLAGEKTAFGPLVERHRCSAIRLALRMLGEPADAADVVQEALLQAFLSLPTLQNPAYFGSWLLGIVVNLCRMHRRARSATYAWEDWSGGHTLAGFAWVDTRPSPDVIYEVHELHRAVLAAIATLPVAQQEAVRLYYLDGLTLQEMSLLVGAPLGTVKARLHRARTRMRQVLGREHGGAQSSLSCAEKEVTMVEVIVHDLMIYVPKDEALKPLQEYQKRGSMVLILLKERQGERVLPMWVGLPEGNALALQLMAVQTPRPMTFELMVRLLDVGSLQVEKVGVTRLHDKILYATLWVRVGNQVHEVDARPSDAINLALRMQAPIFVEPTVLAQAGLPPDRVLPEMQARYQAMDNRPPEDVEMEPRSFRCFPSACDA